MIAGGLDAYAGTYDAIGRRIGIEVGTADAVVLTLVSLLAWALFASTVQVLVYRRGLRTWNDSIEGEPERRWSGIGAENAPSPTTVGDSTPARDHPQCCRCIRVAPR